MFEINLLNVVEDLDGDGEEDHYDLDDDNDGFSDEDEIVAGTNPRDANSMPNRAPDSLSLSNAEVLENEPVGSIIGVFSGTDPDGDVLSFHLNTHTGLYYPEDPRRPNRLKIGDRSIII